MSNQQKPNATSVQIFNFNDAVEIEVLLINGNPWFVAADVCRVLAHSNTTEALKSLDNDEKLASEILRAGQKRLVNLISESGLYALIIRSTKPAAKTFRKWVTSEVLPSIRKTGQYSLQQNMKELEDRCKLLQEQNEEIRKQERRRNVIAHAHASCILSYAVNSSTMNLFEENAFAKLKSYLDKIVEISKESCDLLRAPSAM